jgi:hypothetical protein
MTLHLLHIGKTGGTALKHALQGARFAYYDPANAHKCRETPYGRIQLHRHGFRMADVPPGDRAMFFVRDPIARMVSGFYSRLAQGRPHYESLWTPDERTAFELFPTPQHLASALAGDDAEQRARARWAIRHIRHLRFQQRFTGPPDELRARLEQVVYIGRQETLDHDWRQLKRLLKLPRHLQLPSDPKTAHRRTSPRDASFDERQLRALRRWYARDYRLLAFCDQVRAERSWGASPSRLDRLEIRVRRRAPSPGS